ncbi:uncharacterized protein CYBJADRAFT_43302 [Cyberlindnera jadinii NRRL Y-1542]|uniref:Uncharacterized protein n=1 Tax=Cyberlindnera jadinii (strain ATCC 18201 / CBS 1600 / BCRC 20928 / JCM 3617 / NBRC 0987 / NRRL Y-1542) TaxID=983966 RepID=A0A1E4S6X4_CYBJN|nr:hypothetical protein CYBJADRAFT_43302 [Cyberlindnera jadinii NRRL Y-1542]ODV75271.1 hypothetical protein CYBJADRAFT_43302 [Cyberlindnera jadinii NRRL Y-1542]
MISPSGTSPYWRGKKRCQNRHCWLELIADSISSRSKPKLHELCIAYLYLRMSTVCPFLALFVCPTKPEPNASICINFQRFYGLRNTCTVQTSTHILD